MRNTLLLTILTIVAVANNTNSLHAQTQLPSKPKSLAFNAYTSKNGLSNSHINAINQDSKGYIWIATNDGLNRFDGLNFEVFYSLPDDENTLSSSTVYDIANGKNGIVWFATFKGLCSFDYKTNKFTRYEIPKQMSAVYPLPIRKIINNDSILWLASSGAGLIKMNTKNNSYTFYRHTENTNSICSDHMLTIETDNKGKIWIGTENKGISIFDPNKQTFTHFNIKNDMLKSDCVLSLLYSNGNMYIGTFEGGLSIYNLEEQKITHHTPTKEIGSISGSIVYSLAVDNIGLIFVGTQDAGLQVFDPTKNKFSCFSNKNKNANGLINDNIHAVYFDKDNYLWLGVFQGGLNRLKNKPLFDLATHNPEDPENTLPQKSILSIFPIQNQQILIGTDGGGLCVWDTKNNTFKTIRAGKSGLKSDIIRSVYQGYDKKIWIGTYQSGLQLYNHDTKTFTTYQNNPSDSTSLSHNDVTAIIEDRLGNLWIATNGGGLNLMDKKTGTFKRFVKEDNNPNSLINNWITKLYLDKRGYLWIGTFWGLSRLDPLRYEFKNIELTNSNTYYCMLEDSNERFWAGTMNGLNLIDIENASSQIFTTREGLPNNVINGIEEDSLGNLWISTNNGICRFNYNKKTIRNFSIEDGLQANEFIHGAHAKTENGEIIFGGIEGLNKFFPEKIIQNTTAPMILITNFLIFNKSVPVGELPDGRTILTQSITQTDEITLNHDDNSFTVEFKAIDFIEPQKIKYAVRIKEFNPEWIYYDYNQNSVTFTNLDPGKYHMEIKAANADDIWCTPKTLKINILAPIYKRWYAKLLYCVIVVLLLTILWQWYQKKQHLKQQSKILQIKQQNDIDLNKARLQFFTNISHEFRTPLTLIISPLETMIQSQRYNAVDKKQFEIMHRNAERLLRMVNQIMDLRKIDNEKMQFSPENADIIAFIKEIYENFKILSDKRGTKLSFESDFESLNINFDKEKIDKVIYNLLSNAFKFTPKDGKITISIKKAQETDSNNIVVIVEDTGCGIAQENIDKIFDRFFQNGNSDMQQGTGIGLWLAKHFVEMHNGIISVSSQIGKGTAFTIILPTDETFSSSNSADNYQHLTTESSISNFESTDYVQKQTTEYNDTNKIKQTLLIVEDNADIRQYLTMGLEKLYNIITASNGEEGLEIAHQNMPDLVITDVMMPKMDGNQLCKKLKTDIETCHIPIIMLTAKTTINQKIEGLENGADSYIPKPFNPKHLLVRIEKLLELRKTLREKFSSDVTFNAEETAITIPDRDLLKKTTSVIKKRLSDPSLSVETLSNELGISRGHLQRKLKSLTGQNPNEFIRIIRLKQAAEILKNNDVSIAEVADMVGFGSQSYFSTAFTKQFNISPKQWKIDNEQTKIDNE